MKKKNLLSETEHGEISAVAAALLFIHNGWIERLKEYFFPSPMFFSLSYELNKTNSIKNEFKKFFLLS